MLESYFSQQSYVENVQEKFDMRDAKIVSTILSNHFMFSLDQYSKTLVEVKYIAKVPYASVIGF